MTLVLNQQSAPNPVDVRVAWSPLFELVVAHWSMIVETESIESFLSYEDITTMVTESALSADDAAWMAEEKGSRWVFAIQLIDQSGVLAPQEFADYLRTLPVAAILKAMEAAHSACNDELCSHNIDTPEDPMQDIERIAVIFEGIDAQEVSALAPLEQQLRHEAHLVRFLHRRMGISQLIETVTNGISYSVEAGVEEIVLVPSVMVRPWNLMFRFGGSQYFVYPASDEAIDSDPDTPPSWMTEMFKALGDEKRLKVLRHLTTGPKTLSELTEYLGLAKSTTHHHLRSLRAAGLVLYGLADDDENTFQFREEVLPEALRLIRQYLELDQGEPS